MYLVKLESIPTFYTDNKGREAERRAVYALTHKLTRTDNKNHLVASDVLDIQVKTARATVFFPSEEESRLFAYVMQDFSEMYVMNLAEWTEFLSNFYEVSASSPASSKGTCEDKLRLAKENRRMVQYLLAHRPANYTSPEFFGGL